MGYSFRKIANQLNRQPSTISCELKRNGDYTVAHARYRSNKSHCGAKCFVQSKNAELCSGECRELQLDMEPLRA
ncbi:helix-turn-helix domain-containing protein [Weizmannia ginsengihumi]|nr:helix-turn-helix domain-containing protein [Heyndrickxia ginsengihumi]